jgi:polysaccharide deacetylase family protein (PEP-CTERM system associated)
MVKNKNALTIDLEYWWCNEFLKPYLPDKRADLIIESVTPVLALLKQYNIKATFFVLGSVAEKYPDILNQIADDGHEIGSHAYSHERLHQLGKKQFEEEIRKSKDILGSYDCCGFRAPSFSVDNSVLWYLDILEKYDFQYDSSVFPVKTMLYGVPDAPLSIYKPSKKDLATHDPNGSLFEFPLSVLSFGKNIPVAGGFYFRVIPGPLFRFCIRQIVKSRPAIFYLHPWELYPSLPRFNLPFHYRFQAYYGTGSSSFAKFERLLKEFSFQPLREFLP